MVLNKTITGNNGSIGQVFTPHYVAKFMIKNALSFLEGRKLKVLEPSVGEGVFLKFLLQEGLKNIHAYEIDEKLVDYLVKTYPRVKFKFENFLGSEESEKYDLIVGNPPYLGQNYNAQIFQEYVKNYPICAKYFVGNMDLFYFFIHKAILKLKPGGVLSFITTNYWLTKSKKTGIKLLKPHILEDCFVRQYIDLSSLRMFKGAKGQHNCIFILQKKTEQEKNENANSSVKILKIKKRKVINQLDEDYNEKVFTDLIQEKFANDTLLYESAATNKDLDPERSWNLLYPIEVKKIVNKIEKFCSKNGTIKTLGDFFIVRNGLIFIKDDIFILSEENNLKIENDKISIQIQGKYLRLSEKEKDRLKMIYKSKVIKPYGHNQEIPARYAIYFNKTQFNSKAVNIRNEMLEENYPLLTAYLRQFEGELKNILINAKENPNDLYFPRRGAFIKNLKQKSDVKKEILIDLESLYNNARKIFFKYISNDNIFGYADSSYYATSDTYFLWPKVPETEINYPFLLAYLNSKLVRFLFKAKNIKIKRSKTKVEDELPIPGINAFQSEQERLIIGLVSILSSFLIELNTTKSNATTKGFKSRLREFEDDTNFLKDDLFHSLQVALERKDENFIQKVIDSLMFQLFNLREKEIDSLINKYYHF